MHASIVASLPPVERFPCAAPTQPVPLTAMQHEAAAAHALGISERAFTGTALIHSGNAKKAMRGADILMGGLFKKGDQAYLDALRGARQAAWFHKHHIGNALTAEL